MEQKEKYTNMNKLNFLQKVVSKLRRSMYNLDIDLTVPRIYFEKTLLPPTPLNKVPKPNYYMPFLILVSNPCRHLVEKGGCVMCGYSNLAMFKRKISDEEVYRQFREGFKLIKKIPHHEMIAIGTPGSFLDERETSRKIQRKIIKELDKKEGIYYINIESRAEFITEESLENITESLKDPYKLAIGIGLESSNELVRERCINKNMTTEEYINAVKLLKKYDISPTIYITCGKPFLSVKNDIEDAIHSINFAFDNGADRVVLLRIKVQPHTLIEFLYRKGLYKPTSLWTLIEIIKRIPEKRRRDVLIADPRLPKPLEVKAKCECEATVSELLDQYKGTLDYTYIKAIDEIKCEYKKEMEKEMLKHRSIEKEIEEGHRQLKKYFGDIK